MAQSVSWAKQPSNSAAVAGLLAEVTGSDSTGAELPVDFADVKVVSLPNGCNSLPPDVLPMLEQFEKIFLYMDNDAAGHDATEKVTSPCFVLVSHFFIDLSPNSHISPLYITRCY